MGVTARYYASLEKGWLPLEGALVPAGWVDIDLADAGGADYATFVVDGRFATKVATRPYILHVDLAPGEHRVTGRAEGVGKYRCEFRVAPRPPAPLPPAVTTPVLPPAPVIDSTPPLPAGESVEVRTATQLTEALAHADPHMSIVLADGVYAGRFTLQRPDVSITGSPDAVIDGGDLASGYAFYVIGADRARLAGFTVRGAQKSVVVDRSNFVALDGLDTGRCGMESVHIRSFSCDAQLTALTVHDTGLHTPDYGEGIYIGSAKGANWNRWSGGKPDAVLRTTVEKCRIFKVIGEMIDIKEGSANGVISGNFLDGSMQRGVHFADSWVDVKGDGYEISGNHGVNSWFHGYETHIQLPPYGHDNIFARNICELRSADAYGFNIHRGDVTNTVRDDNIVSGGKGVANIPLTRA